MSKELSFGWVDGDKIDPKEQYKFALTKLQAIKAVFQDKKIGFYPLGHGGGGDFKAMIDSGVLDEADLNWEVCPGEFIEVSDRIDGIANKRILDKNKKGEYRSVLEPNIKEIIIADADVIFIFDDMAGRTGTCLAGGVIWAAYNIKKLLRDPSLGIYSIVGGDKLHISDYAIISIQRTSDYGGILGWMKGVARLEGNAPITYQDLEEKKLLKYINHKGPSGGYGKNLKNLIL